MTRDIRWRTLAALVMMWGTIAGPASADVAEVFRQMFATASRVPHPSVVQVLAPDQEAISRGSGTLIHVDGQFGYVITNWHVVREAEREVMVIFPDGYQSLARILKMNKDWDLALLLIWAGTERPMPLATVGPRPGDELQIAGYGAGDFRAQRGKFSTFAAPQPDMPFEMFEVMATARQGDSGGPIINQRGELVGVLFGAGDGRTTGTQIGRVRMFVNEAFDELRDRVDLIAQQQPTDAGRLAAQAPPPVHSGLATTTGQGALPQMGIDEPPQFPGELNSGLAAEEPSSTGLADPGSKPWLDAPALIGSENVPPVSDARRAVSSKGQLSESVRLSEGGTSPAPRTVEAWQSNQNSSAPHAQQPDALREGAIAQQRLSPTPSLTSGSGECGDYDAGLSEDPVRMDSFSDPSGADDRIASAMARPAEVSRRDLAVREELFHANNGTRMESPATAAIGSDRDVAAIPQPGGGMHPIGPAAAPISGGVTWEQIRSFFAAVGVFAVLHAIVKTFAFAPAKKSRR